MSGAVPAAWDPDAALDAYLDAAVVLARLELSPESRGAVRENLALLLRLGQLFEDAPLAGSLDPAPVFRP